MSSPRDPSPYVVLERSEWARLALHVPQPLTADEVERLRGLGTRLDVDEVATAYLPLSRLLDLWVRATDALHGATAAFLGGLPERTPYVIAVCGSVAVGKSTTARLLQQLLARWPDHPRVELVTTDGFLHPNAELQRRGLLTRKGFPESYDRRALLAFVSAVKSGAAEVRAPVYSHLTYDIVPGEYVVVRRPDVLILEGLNVLQPAAVRAGGSSGPAVSDFFDISLYVDAATADIRRWYVERFLELRGTAFQHPESYFRRYADLSEDEAIARAEHLWDTINAPNLVHNVEPTRDRATLVLEKGPDHAMRRVRMRKL